MWAVIGGLRFRSDTGGHPRIPRWSPAPCQRAAPGGRSSRREWVGHRGENALGVDTIGGVGRDGHGGSCRCCGGVRRDHQQINPITVAADRGEQADRLGYEPAEPHDPAGRCRPTRSAVPPSRAQHEVRDTAAAGVEAVISPGNSSPGSVDRGHRPQSSNARPDRVGARRSLGTDGADWEVAVAGSTTVVIIAGAFSPRPPVLPQGRQQRRPWGVSSAPATRAGSGAE